MTHRQRFIDTLQCKKIGGQVPHFEIVFFLTMESIGMYHSSQTEFRQWDQMSFSEKKLHINYAADMYIKIAQKYNHSAIFVHPYHEDFENVKWLLETIREKTGDEYFLTMHGDSTHAIPDGDNMMEFSINMYENPDKLNDISKKNLEQCLEFGQKFSSLGLLDGFTLCSDYALNANPFFSPDTFEELIVPYLFDLIAGYREMGYYTIKHTDGNIMPILKQIADCKPDALHSLDPQGGMNMLEVRKIIGNDICLIGNVNCGVLQTGTDEECKEDIIRSLREGMDNGRGYIFSTSNCAYTGLSLDRYEMMVDIWKQHGNYNYPMSHA